MQLVNGTIDQFCEVIKNKKLICIGSGKVLRYFAEVFESSGVVSQISYIADNDVGKVGREWKYKNHTIPIISVEQAVHINDIMILISCADVASILEQLDQYEQLKNTVCYVANYIRSETNLRDEERRWYPDCYRITSEPLIPKKIHYCWFGGKPIPDRNLQWMESWKKYCPDYEIIRWDENNYDVTKNQYMHEAYRAAKWGFVPDYARLDIIYNEGGIYLDTDVEIIRNIDDLLYQKAFMGIDSSTLISLGLGFGAVVHHPLIKELLEEYRDRKFIRNDGSYDLTSCPSLQKEIFHNKGYINNGNYQIIDDVTVYPEKVLSGKCNLTGRVRPTGHTFMIHHYDGSWAPKEMKNRKVTEQKLFGEKFAE